MHTISYVNIHASLRHLTPLANNSLVRLCKGVACHTLTWRIAIHTLLSHSLDRYAEEECTTS